MSQTSVSSTLAKLRSAKSIKPYDPYKDMFRSLGNTNMTVHEDFSGFGDVKINPYVKQYKVNESTEDLLALSVAWFRLRKNSASKPLLFESLTDASLFSKVTEEDRLMANTIRDYYSKKIMVLALKEVKLSKFREDLSKFIHGNGKVFTDDILPLVYRLPEFYEYDTEFADMMRGLTPGVVDRTRVKTEVHTLRPLRKFDVKRKYNHKHEYWFKDENDRPVLIMLEHFNSCKSLFEREYKKESMSAAVTGFVTSQDDHTYFKVSKWEVE